MDGGDGGAPGVPEGRADSAAAPAARRRAREGRPLDRPALMAPALALLALAACHAAVPPSTIRGARETSYSRARRSRSALPITDTELALIAALAIIRLSRRPNTGYSTPAAIGTPSRL